MKYCLWLYGKKAYTLDDVLENFDTDSLSAYLLGGSLGRWLRSIEEDKLAAEIEKINPRGNLDRQLKICFGLETAQETTENTASAGFPLPPCVYEYHPFGTDYGNIRQTAVISDNPQNVPAPAIPSSGSFNANNSYPYGSFSGGSYSSLTSSGFAIGSYSFGSLTSGSFAVGSYKLGSFFYGSGGLLITRTSSGCFLIDMGGVKLTESEYKRTMINLSSCPLNSRGYGIHVIQNGKKK